MAKVHKTIRFEGMDIKIDRPKGFVMKGVDSEGTPWTRTYQYDYGFIPKTKGGDGDGIDVFIGPNEAEADDAHWVTQLNDEGKFDEYKVFLGFPTKAEAKKAYMQHIPKKYFGGMISMTVQMMKAMLGKEPAEKLGSVTLAGFLSELRSISRGHVD